MSQNIVHTSCWGPGHTGLVYNRRQKDFVSNWTDLELKIQICFHFLMTAQDETPVPLDYKISNTV